MEERATRVKRPLARGGGGGEVSSGGAVKRVVALIKMITRLCSLVSRSFLDAKKLELVFSPPLRIVVSVFVNYSARKILTGGINRDLID